ncbi:DUF2336 domain-containing protein [Sphingomonas hankyongi]|uniref:DUF2336 domain-containing protein n=1 Tax=Sphingomonas hankyongi TaxID=2908209 RepID=A0ABT0S433_9SPHN|nr:DUF2336 domain-containing protein [Sphingomonas hankyongi]MCL6730622.1 DUF2336 domain-containing protein [Sphingomonas hankyongi]
MLPEEWPIAAPAADQNAPARLAGRDRLSTVRTDFFLHPEERLTEQERALMTAMLHCLVGDIADELRAALPSGLSAANDDGNLRLVEVLVSRRLLDRPALVSLLLRRADEERIATAAAARSGRRESRVLQGLVSHADGAVAAAAMALILGRGKRRDRFGQCLLHFDDLPTAEAGSLVHSICAALRPELGGIVGSAAADRQLSEAARQVLASHDPGSGIEALTATLARMLDEEEDLGEEAIVAAAMEGEMTFVAEAVSRRSGIPADVVFDELLSADERRSMAVLRTAKLSRQVAASLLAGIGDLLGMANPGKAIDVFDALTDAEIESARTWLTTDQTYRDAVTALGFGHGKRTV